jgi:hypothetical protein
MLLEYMLNRAILDPTRPVDIRDARNARSDVVSDEKTAWLMEADTNDSNYVKVNIVISKVCNYKLHKTKTEP